GMLSVSFRCLPFILAIALAACAPAPRAADQPGTSPSPGTQPSVAGRPLNIAVRYEVNDLAPKRTGGASTEYTKRAFNASLAIIDSNAAARPYLAETLPQLNTENWQVSS